jgi:hypothetical protein
LKAKRRGSPLVQKEKNLGEKTHDERKKQHTNNNSSSDDDDDDDDEKKAHIQVFFV